MTTTSPPNLQVVGPEAAPAAPAAEPKADYVDPGPAEDRILSPEETENFFRTGSIEDPPVVADPPVIDPEQQQMVGDHFDQVAGEPGAAAAAIPAAPQTPQQMAQQDVQAPAPQPVPVVAPQQVPPLVQQTPNEVALQGQVQGLTTQIQQMATQMASLQQQPQQAQAQAQQQAPQFNFQVPSQYAEAIASEDPNMRTQAINSLLNGVAASVHQQTLKDVDDRISNIAPQVNQQVQLAQKQAEIKSDMYGAYPELSGMQDMVVAAATQLQSQYPGGWSQDYRDAIAERLSPLVQGLPQKVQQNRASRGVMPQQQFLPQGPPQGQLPPGVGVQQVQGGGHVAPAVAQQGQPVLVRDAAGNYSQVYPQQHQQQFAGAQVRPGGVGQVDPGLQDIWSTLGF